jgi:hypothetical protein
MLNNTVDKNEIKKRIEFYKKRVLFYYNYFHMNDFELSIDETNYDTRGEAL